MKIIDNTKDGAIIELTRKEIGIIGLVGLEFTQGQYSPPDEMWDSAIPDTTREQVADLFEALPSFE